MRSHCCIGIHPFPRWHFEAHRGDHITALLDSHIDGEGVADCTVDKELVTDLPRRKDHGDGNTSANGVQYLSRRDHDTLALVEFGCNDMQRENSIAKRLLSKDAFQAFEHDIIVNQAG